jgi:hypothetical protein
MTQHFSIELFASGVYRVLLSAALVVAIAVIGLLATAATPQMAPPLSTVTESAPLPPSAAGFSPQGRDRDQAGRTNDDDYLEGLVKALDHGS